MSISNGSEGSGSDWMLLDNDNAHQQDNEEGAAMPLEEEVTAQEKTRECSDEERTEVNKENVKETNIKSQEKIKSTLSVKEKINQKRQEGKSKSTSLKEEIDEKVKERKRNNAQEKNHEEVELGELEENLEELEYKVEEVKGRRYHKISTGTESSDIEILDCHSNWQEIDGDFHHVQFVNPLTLPTCFSSIQQNEQITTQSYSNMSTYRQKRSSYSGIPAHSRQLVSPSSSGIPAHSRQLVSPSSSGIPAHSRQLVSPSSSGIHSHRFHVPPSLSGINHQPVEGYLRSFRYQDYIYDSDTDTESQCAEDSAVDRLRRRRSQKSEATQDEETDLSLVSSPSLPEDLPAIRPDSQYVHTPHDSLNYRLNVILMLTVACVIGLGLGHFLGWSEGWADRTVFDANMNAAQVRRLRELQENLLSCLNSVHQLTQNLENYPIPVDQSGLHGFSPHEHSEERVFRSRALLERDLDQDPSSERQFLGSRSSPRFDSLDAENYRISKFKSKETQSNHRDVVDFKASQKFLDLRVSDKLISESDAEPGDILELSNGEQLKKVDAKDLNFLRLINTEKFEHFDKFEVNRIENAVNSMTNFAKNTKEIFEKNEIESEKNVDSKMKEIDPKRKLIVSETKEIESEENVADSENNEIEFEKDVADFESNEIEFEKNVADFKSNEIEFEKNEIFSDDLEIDSEFVGTENVENSIYEIETESFYSFDESFDTPDFSGELVEKLEDSGIINLDNDYKTNDHDLKVEENLLEVEFENIEEKTNNFDQKSESFVGAEHDQVALDDLIYPAHFNRDFHDELFVDDDIYQENGKVNNEKNNQKKEKDYQKHDNYQKNVDDLNCVKNHPYDDDLIFPVIDEENSDYLSEKLLQYKVSDNSFGDEIITVDNSYKHNHLKNDLIVKEPDLVPEGKEISKIDGFKIISEMNGNFENYADNYDNFEKNDENLQNSKVLNTEFDFNTHMKTRFENEPIKIDLFHFNLARENENFFKKTTTNVLKFESEKRSELKTDVIPFIAEYSKIFPKDIDAKSPLLKAIHDDDFTELDEFSESTDPENSLDKLSESTDPEKLLDTFSESTDSENLFDKLSESTDSENLLETFSESTDSGNLLDSPESDPVDPYFYFENPSTADYFNSIQEMNSIRENKTVNNRGGWKPDADSVNNFSDKFCSVNKELMKENERGFLSELSSLSLDFDYMKANLNTNYDTNRKVDIDENLKFKLVDIDQNNDEQCANKDLNIEEMDNVSIFSFEILPNNEIKMKKPFNLPRNLPKDAKIEPVLPHNEITSKNNGSKIDSILPNIVLETNKKVLEDLQLENVVLEKDVAKLQNENQDKFKIKGREGEESRLLRQEITDLIAENEAIKTALLGERFSQSDNTGGNISGDFYQENLMKHHKLSLEKEKFVHLVSDVEELRASLKSLKATNEELNKQLIVIGIEQDIPKELNPLVEQLVKIREKLSVEETKKDSAENDAILKAKAYLAYMTQVVSVFPRMSKFSELEPEEKVDVATDVFSFVVPKGLKLPPKARNELAKAKTQFGSIKESLSKKYKRLKSLTTGEGLSAAKGASLDKMKRVIVSVVNKMKDIGQKIILKPAVEATKKTTEDKTTLQNLETLTESIFKLNTDFDHAWQTLEEQQNITIKIDDEKSEINANEKIENVNNKTKISSKNKKFEVKKDKNNNKIEKEKRNYKLKNENNRKYNKTGKKLSEKVEKYQEKNLNMEKSKSLKLEKLDLSPKNDENLSPKKDEDGKNSEYYKGQYNKADKIAKTSHENSENMEKSAKKSDAKKETSVLGQIWTKSTERKMKFIRRGGKNKYKSRNESSLENFESLGGVYESSLEKIESFGDESSFRSKNVESNNNNNNGKYFKDKNNRDNLHLLKFKNIENKNLKNKISKNEKFNDDFEKRKLRKLLENNPEKLENNTKKLENNPDKWGKNYGKLKGKVSKSKSNRGKLESKSNNLESNQDNGKDKSIKNLGSTSRKLESKPEELERKTNKLESDQARLESKRSEFKNKKVKNEINFKSKENGKNEVKESKSRQKIDNKDYKNEVKESKSRKKIDNKENKNEVKERKLHKKDENKENKNEVKEKKLHKKEDNKENQNEIKEKKLHKKDDKENKNEVKEKKLHKKDENKENKNEVKEKKLHKKEDNKENKNEVKENKLHKKVDSKEKKNEVEERGLRKKVDNKKKKFEVKEKKLHKKDENKKNKNEIKENKLHKKVDNKENKNEVKERGLRNKIDNKENKNEAKEREQLKKGDNKRSKKKETESKNCDHRNKYKSKETDSRWDKNFDSKHKIANIKNFKPRNLQFKNEEGKKKQKYNKFENNKKYDREAQRKRHESVEKFSKINRVKRTTDEEGKYKRKEGKVRVNYKEGKDRSRQEKYAGNDMFSKNNEKYREKKDNFEDGKNVILKKIENYDREKGTLESKEKINRNTIAKKTDKNSRTEDNFVSKNKKNYNKRLKHENKKENEKSKGLIDREKYQHKRAKYGDGKRGRNLMHETESKFDEDERIVKEKKENLGKDEKVESNRLKPQEKINKNIKKEKMN